MNAVWRKLGIALTAIALAAVFMVLAFASKTEKQGARPEAVPVAQSGEGVTTAIPTPVPPPAVFWSNLPPNIQLQLTARSRKEWEARRLAVGDAWVKQRNGRIDFWGMVVDQDGKPLEGVEVEMNVRQWNLGFTLDAKFPAYRSVSDASGRFALLDSTGDSMNIKEVKKAGYVWPELDKKLNHSFPYHGMATQFIPDPAAPVVLRLWKSKGATGLIQHDHASLRVAVDGTPAGLNLITGKRVETGGHFFVELVRDPPEFVPKAGTNKYDWRAKFTIPGGGLQWRTDLFGYEAPIGGYQESLEFGLSHNDADWRGEVRSEFYFQTREGYYGRVAFFLGTRVQPPPCIFNGTVWLNPSGSRNLEYDFRLRVDPRKLGQK